MLCKENQPKYKLEVHGASVMTITELLAVILGSGETNLNLAKIIIKEKPEMYSLGTIRNINELTKIRGIGENKAGAIIAAIELGKRIAEAKTLTRKSLSSPEDAGNYFTAKMRYLSNEHFYVTSLNAKNQLIKTEQISEGSLNMSIVHQREVFNSAITNRAAAILVAHNHPSGDPTPSREDRSLTDTLKEAGQLLGIPLVDHIVIGDGKFFSFKEHGYL